MLGLEDGKVRLFGHQPEWAGLFIEEKKRLQAAIGAYILDIQHIGSTSIPALPAKPILDIAIGVADFETAEVCIPPLQQIGYHYRGEHGISRRHYFVRGAQTVRGQVRTHHLHVLEMQSEQWRQHLLFRDTLRRNPQLASEFAIYKRKIASMFKDDRAAYQAAKDVFVSRMLAKWESAQ
ncbi:MAG: GrpB family protein [Anaerolineales bacterium]|nr:MAG: GrpB family protein [Anaerolineales bacterium]